VAPEAVAIVTAGDMPWVTSDLLAALARAVGEGTDLARVQPTRHGGSSDPLPATLLPFAVLVTAGRPVARRCLEAGERRLGAFVASFASVAVLDADPAQLRDVDVAEDLRQT
jgi:molybdopterin-guanine dinucleotide biosynthesis protein A